jgi:hypothetical protein
MGLLSVGTPLEWKDAEKFSDHVREHGIEVCFVRGDLTLAISEYLESGKGKREGCSFVG